MSNEKKWIPEIMYEEDVQGISQALPFILVPDNEEMPRFLLIWEYRETGEFEPGPNGEELPITESELRQYAQMEVLKNNLTPEEYDRVREALGLKPLSVATKLGKEITKRVRDNTTIKSNMN